MGRYLVAEIDEDAFQHEEGQTADIGFFRPSDQIWSKHKDIIFKAIAVQADVVGNGVHTVYGDVFPEPERFRDWRQAALQSLADTGHLHWGAKDHLHIPRYLYL